MNDKKREALATPSPGSILTIERELDAALQKVWMAWTTPDLIARWWGPKGYAAPVARVSLRVGGSYLYCLRSPEGKETWSTGFFREIVPLQRLVATDSFADDKGNVVPASHYGLSDDFPLEMLMTVIFEEDAGKTRLTLKHAGLPPGRDMEGARRGWNESFDRLAAMLAE
ncbi:MAG: SRPBCC domain-containing protein [Acidobacteriota bacterium]